MSAAPLLPEPLHRYQLFQALRLLESALGGGPRLGERGPADHERLRLRPSTSMGFPTAELVEVVTHARPDGTPRATVTTNLPGLYGVGSPLPRSYAHQILLEDDDQPQTRQFLDLLHHRLLSLWYRTWKHSRYEQSYQPDGRDLLSRALLDLIGLSPDTTAQDVGTQPTALLRYLGLLLHRSRPISGLQILLGEELGLPLTIEQTPLRTVTLPREQWFQLSTNPQLGGCLGRDVTIGGRRVDRLTQLRLHIGPVSYETLRALLPGGPLLTRLVALSRFYLRQPLDLSLHVQVPAAQVARTRLGGKNPSALGAPTATGAPTSDPVVFAIEVMLHRTASSRRMSVVKTREV